MKNLTNLIILFILGSCVSNGRYTPPAMSEEEAKAYHEAVKDTPFEQQLMLSSDDVTEFLNVALSPPIDLDCNRPGFRARGLLDGERGFLRDIDKYSCADESLTDYTSLNVEGKVYKVPKGADVEEFLSICGSDGARLAGLSEVQREFYDYSNSEAVEEMLSTLRLNSRTCLTPKNTAICERTPPPDSKDGEKPTGYCLRYVKLGVVGGGFTDTYPGGVAAKDSGSTWKRMGFRNLLDEEKYSDLTAYDAPKGAIIVYSGGRYGHVEVRGEEDEFMSDYIGKNPIYDELGLPRRVIGIYVK